MPIPRLVPQSRSPGRIRCRPLRLTLQGEQVGPPTQSPALSQVSLWLTWFSKLDVVEPPLSGVGLKS